ncbi:MAG: N-acetylmuramoyl-L-alanine amidase [Chitinophagaceae bacterium]
MKIVNHLLYDNNNKQVDFRPTPNKGGTYTPQYLVMHYTASTNEKGSISWFLNKNAQASAHLLIDRDGSITQFAPFNIVTWHAGVSEWNGLVGLNKFAIGIELVNGGKLVKSNNSWICPVDHSTIADSDVIVATHKNESSPTGWQTYTNLQLELAIEVATLLVKTYGLKDVVGHDDIAPHRKTDPGPAFPMNSFRSRVMGRKDSKPATLVTTTSVNIRSGAGTQFSPVTDPLPKNTAVEVLKRDGNWSFVNVVDEVHDLNDLEGWIMSKFLAESA